MAKSISVQWRQVLCGFVLLATVSTLTTGFSVVAKPLAAEFQVSRMLLMTTMTLLSLATAVMAPFLGSLMDRFSIRTFMITGAVLIGAGYAALTVATTFNQVLFIYAIILAPANVLIGPIAVTVLLARWFNERRGAAIGVAISGIAMGTIIFPPVIQALLDHHDWRVAMRLFSLIILACTLPAALLVTNRPILSQPTPESVAAAALQPPTKSVSAKDILTDPAFWLIASILAAVLSGMKGMVTNVVSVATDEGVPASQAALLMSTYGACGFVSKLGFATIADRLNPRILLIISLLGFSSGMAVLTQASMGFGIIALGVGLVGFFGGFMTPMESLLASRIFGRERTGRAIGLMSTVTLTALLATPPLFGGIYDRTGSYTLIFAIFAALGIATLLTASFVRLHPKA